MAKRKWLRAILIGGVLILLASFGFSRALRATAARRYLSARLAASFGRPVDVLWFDFSLLDGARIEAHYVTVLDDPHFGNEYFLRAETLAAGIRWTALLGGRFEFGSVALSRPSLNLARDAEGRWNIESWLPPAPQATSRPGFVGPVAPSRELQATRPYRIDVDGGRINFKQGDNKNPFALVDVSGRVEENGASRWQLDLEARPMRAGVELQDIGTVRLRGSIAGTTARLQPADLNLTWRAGSVADALRLVRDDDYGMRGRLALDLDARIAPQKEMSSPAPDAGGARWSISAVARLTGIHGWRLTERDTDPAANLSAEVTWRLGESRVDIRKLLVEMPASRLQGSGVVDWEHHPRPELRLESSTVALGDILSWYRALQPDVAEDLRADGTVGLDLKLGGWPLELQQGTIAGTGGTLTAKALPGPLRIGAVNASVSHGGLEFAAAEISFAPRTSAAQPGTAPVSNEPRNSFVVRGALFPGASGAPRWPPDWNFSVEGATSRVQDWLAMSTALAHPVGSSWTAAGGLAVKMRGSRRADSPHGLGIVPGMVAGMVPGRVPENAQWLGTMDLLGLDLSPAYVNQPVQLSKAHVEFAPQQRTITISAAEAFGTVWHGSVARKFSDKQWTFDLSADHLDAAEMDRWLGPRARPGFLARLTGSSPAAGATPPADAVVTQLAARGRLRAGAIDVPPMHLEQFDGEVELAGRTVRVRQAQANFFGGKISGSLDAQLVPDPSYEFQGRFDRVDLVELGSAVPFLDTRIGGSASAALTLSAHGVGREGLIGSMQGRGTLNGRNVVLRGFQLSSVFPGNNPDAASDVFSAVQGTFRIQTSGIDLANIVLDGSRGRLEGEGRIDFSHALNIRLHPSVFQASAVPATASPPSFLLGGTIEAPKLALPSAAPKRGARPNSR